VVSFEQTGNKAGPTKTSWQ